MNITRDNYEIFFLDYLEGHLEESLIDEFLDFLEQNPDLKEELHLFENIHLPHESIAFPGKKQLYRLASEERESFDLKAVALMEGDLKEEDHRSLEAYLEEHPELKKEAALFEKTRLLADKSIRFPEKEKLYRRSKTLIWVNWLGRAAAVVLLFWGVYALYQNGNNQDLRIGREVAEAKDEGTEVEETGDRRQETGDGRLDEGTKAEETGDEESLASLSSPKSPKGLKAEEKENGERRTDEGTRGRGDENTKAEAEETGDEESLASLSGPKSPKGLKAEEKENGERRTDEGTRGRGDEKTKAEAEETGDEESLASHSGPKGLKSPQAEEKAMAIAKIDPIMARLETASGEAKLAVSRAINSEKINDPGNVMTVDQYLAKRAKKATNEGLLSAHRIIRVGLNVASELSGERIGYTVKEGKVASLGFESKLLAFSIPLEKK